MPTGPQEGISTVKKKAVRAMSLFPCPYNEKEEEKNTKKKKKKNTVQ